MADDIFVHVGCTPYVTNVHKIHRVENHENSSYNLFSCEHVLASLSKIECCDQIIENCLPFYHGDENNANPIAKKGYKPLQEAISSAKFDDLVEWDSIFKESNQDRDDHHDRKNENITANKKITFSVLSPKRSSSNVDDNFVLPREFMEVKKDAIEKIAHSFVSFFYNPRLRFCPAMYFLLFMYFGDNNLIDSLINRFWNLGEVKNLKHILLKSSQKKYVQNCIFGEEGCECRLKKNEIVHWKLQWILDTAIDQKHVMVIDFFIQNHPTLIFLPWNIVTINETSYHIDHRRPITIKLIEKGELQLLKSFCNGIATDNHPFLGWMLLCTCNGNNDGSSINKNIKSIFEYSIIDCNQKEITLWLFECLRNMFQKFQKEFEYLLTTIIDSSKGSFAISKILPEISFSKCQCAFEHAIERGNTKAVISFMDADPRFVTPFVLERTTQYGHLDMLKHLLNTHFKRSDRIVLFTKNYTCFLNGQRQDGIALLNIAAENRQSAIFHFLLQTVVKNSSPFFFRDEPMTNFIIYDFLYNNKVFNYAANEYATNVLDIILSSISFGFHIPKKFLETKDPLIFALVIKGLQKRFRILFFYTDLVKTVFSKDLLKLIANYAAAYEDLNLVLYY